MKVIFCFILSSILSFGQSVNRFPFQVLDAQNAFMKNGQEIQRFKFIQGSKQIVLKNGNIYLIHFSGIPFHFQGDTIVDLNKINIRQNNLRMIGDGRPKVESFFKGYPSIPKMIHDYHPFFIFPPQRTSYSGHHIEDDICLKWKNGYGKVKVEITNVFGDTIRTLETDSNSLTIPKTMFKGAFLDAELLLVGVKSQKYWDTYIFKLFRNDNYHGLFSCSITSAEQALMVAYYLESGWLRDEAESYYRLCIELSPDKVFQDALRYFFLRKGN
jgi:hypothetical protein